MDCKSTSVAYDDIHRCTSAGFRVRVFDITDEFSRNCVKLVKSLGLEYGAIDFILDKDNRPVFLEVNPTGDWYWIERKVRLPITRAMVDLIASFM